jgi:hypothetical protein
MAPITTLEHSTNALLTNWGTGSADDYKKELQKYGF